MMLDVQRNPMCLLLVLNSLAVIVAVLLSQLLRVRMLTAVIAHAVALFLVFQLRNATSASTLGWRLLIEEPASSLIRPLITGTSWQVPSVIGTIGLIATFVAPLVFAYWAAWLWTTRRKIAVITIRKAQIPLKTVLVVVTLCCLGLGFRSWLDAQVMAVYPTAATAICLALRPWSWTARFREVHRDNKRMAEVRDRIQHAPESFWHDLG